jgi:hypothetical protein
MTHLSDVFKYISHFRHAGHQVGRKVGDMLEVLTYAALTADPDLGARLHIEPKLYGFCDAGHKVEFAVLANPTGKVEKAGEIRDPARLIGFIECKKVGVEQTTRLSFKTAHKDQDYLFSGGHSLTTVFSRKLREKVRFMVHFHVKEGNALEVSVLENGTEVLRETVTTGHRIMFAMTANHLRVLGNGQSLRDIQEPLLSCHVLDFTRVHEGTAKVILNDCLAGPQTPEKAKQASFVALDVRKLRYGQFDRRDEERQFVSVLVLTEFSHWEPKSINVVRACLDKVVVVPDSILVDAFERFEAAFGPVFYDRIAKDKFETDPEVRRIALEVIRDNDNGKIFQDIDDNLLKRLAYLEGSLRFIA